MTVNSDPSPIAKWDTFWANYGAIEKPSPVVAHIVRMLGGNVAGKRILEIGAGSGRDIVAFARAGAQCIALDKSPVARARIAESAQKAGVAITVLGDDLRAISLPDDSVDVVYSQGVVEHFHDVDAVLQEQRRVVAPGHGRLVVDVPQRYNPYTLYKHIRMLAKTWPPGWETEFSPGDFKRLAGRNGLRLIDVYAWGEHGRLTNPVLGPLDAWPWTAMCIGGIFQKT